MAYRALSAWMQAGRFTEFRIGERFEREFGVVTIVGIEEELSTLVEPTVLLRLSDGSSIEALDLAGEIQARKTRILGFE